jgi:hypothetical protein
MVDNRVSLRSSYLLRFSPCCQRHLTKAGISILFICLIRLPIHEKKAELKAQWQMQWQMLKS